MRRSERSTNSVVLRAMLFRWDADDTSWSEHGTEVELLQKSNRTPFASGECRDAYRVECKTKIFNDHSSPHYVLKLSRPDYYKSINGKQVLLKSDATKAAHEAEVASAMLSRGYADEWNLVAAPLGYMSIHVVPAALVLVGNEWGTVERLVEPFLPPGAFIHYNDPFGQEEFDGDLEVKETLAAFSHFTMTSAPTFVGADKFDLGANLQVVLDLQGTHVRNEVILTDVQICRRSGPQLGSPLMEIQQAGFGGFCLHHKCSAVCTRLMKAKLMGKLPAKGKLRQVATSDGKVWILK